MKILHSSLLLLLILVSCFVYVTDAEAIKSKGTQVPKFGHDTRHIVCGDQLCSELESHKKIKNMDAYFDDIRGNPTMLFDFFKQMPKGADLHNHLSGNIHPDVLIQIASDNQLCFNLETAKLVKAESETLSCPEEHELVSNVYTNKSQYDFLLQSWSIYDFDPDMQSGHDHFFAVFGKIGQATKHIPTTLGYWKTIAEEQNMHYMETMFNDPYVRSEISELSSKISVNDTSDFTEAYDTLLSEIQKRGTITTSVENISYYDKESTVLCMEEQYSCDIPFRYIFQVLRAYESDSVFTQMVIGFETAKQSEHVIAVNMVQPEDDANAIRNYDFHMQMLSFLKERYPTVNITLHAGELWPTLPNIDPKVDMTFHIHDAIQKGGAQRIGHGVDIQTEIERFPDLLDIIKSNDIAVEINLNSNYVILDVMPDEHPILFYLENDIPIMLSTDDPGILLSDMTLEYVTAAQNYPEISYSDFKNMNRNSLEYSFLPGKSLWVDPGEYEIQLVQCDETMPETVNCWSDDTDEKAALEYKLELALDEFEGNLGFDE